MIKNCSNPFLYDVEKRKLENQQQEFEEKRKKQNEIFQERLQQERQKMEQQTATEREKFQAEMQQQIRKSVAQDYENKLRILQESDKEKEEKLRSAQTERTPVYAARERIGSPGKRTGIAGAEKGLAGKGQLAGPIAPRRRTAPPNEGRRAPV
jgi:hypothetical protein